MASYATAAEARELTAGNYELSDETRVTEDKWNLALERASRDVDAYIGWPFPKEDRLRINVADELSDGQAAALKRAVIEQASYRLQLGESERVVDSLRHGLRGEGTQIVPPAPRYAPQMREALADAGLYKRSGTAPPADDAA
jgi:hypothetical protein